MHSEVSHRQAKTPETHSQHNAIVNGPANNPKTSFPVSNSHTQLSQQLNTNQRAKADREPSFNLYGYQPNQLSFITPAQLKENSSSESNSSSSYGPASSYNMPPPAAHHGTSDKRESSPMDSRSSTPGSRNCTPTFGRPPSLSPKQLHKDLKGLEHPSHHHTSGSGAFKLCADYNSVSAAPPAHQSSSPRIATPNMSSSLQQSLSNAYHVIQEQPQNLVKEDSKLRQSQQHISPKLPAQLEHSRLTPPNTAPSKLPSTTSSRATGYSYHLIQQGLVPNPLYSTPSSLPSAVTNPTATTASPKPLPPSSTMSSQSRPGIVSGIPICRPSDYPMGPRSVTHQNQKFSISAIVAPNSTGRPPQAALEASKQPLLTPQHQALHQQLHLIRSNDPNRSQQCNSDSIHQQQAMISQNHRRLILNHAPEPSTSSRIVSAPMSSPYGPPPGGIILQPSNLNSSSAHSAHSAHLNHSSQGQLIPPPAHSANQPLNLQNASAKRKPITQEAISGDVPNSKKSKPGEMTSDSSPANVLPIEASQEIASQQKVSTTVLAQQQIPVALSSAVDKDASLSVNNKQQNASSNPQKDSCNSVAKEVPRLDNFVSKHQKAKVAARSKRTAENIPNTTTSPIKSTSDDKVVSSVSDSNSSAGSGSFHPKLKKAWLQRHSEDKVGINPASSGNSNISNPTTTTTANATSTATSSSSTIAITTTSSMPSTLASTKSAASNSASSDNNIKESKDKLESNVNVNGGIKRKGDNQGCSTENVNKDDDETSSASETATEPETSSKESYVRTNRKRRIGTRKQINLQQTKAELRAKRHKVNSSSSSNTDNGKDEDAPSKTGKNGRPDKRKKDKNLKSTERESSRINSRRGRPPKSFKSDASDRVKKSMKEQITTPSSISRRKRQRGKLDRPTLAELKKSGEPFLQGGSCVDVAPKLPKCRECRMTVSQRIKKPTVFCRFYDYRKLAFKNEIITISGFSQPKDASLEDLKLWLPSECPPDSLDTITARFLLAHVGDQFCDLVKQEKDAQLLHMGDSTKTITWKRVVQGVREMCDVCETTLFNIHWVCDKCGFVVCIDCYRARKVGTVKEEKCPAKDKDGFQWLLCNNRQQHEPKNLEMTQIIAAQALSNVGRLLHQTRDKWGITANCSCVCVNSNKDSSIKESLAKKPNGFSKQVMGVVKNSENQPLQLNGVNDSRAWKSMNNNNAMAIIKQESDSALTGYSSESGNSPLSFFVDIALTSEKLVTGGTKAAPIKEECESKSAKKKNSKDRDSKKNSELIAAVDANTAEDDENKHSTLRELLMGPTSKGEKGKPAIDSSPNNANSDTASSKKGSIDLGEKKENVVANLAKSGHGDHNEIKENEIELQHFMRRYVPPRRAAVPLPILRRSLDETKKLYPNVPHNWFCQGRLLMLHDPENKDNINLFQEQWIRGQVIK